MSRYRLVVSPGQERVLRIHCAHARYVWNLAVEQQSWWRPGRRSAPGYVAQSAQLTEARAASGWLRAGSQTVQQQALRDFAQAMTGYFAGTHGKPTWRKAGRNEGFRIVAVKPAHVRRLSRKTGEVWVPKAGWLRFRWSRAVPAARSYRVTCDRAGRWHVAFAAIPAPILRPGTGRVVGIDRGVIVSAAKVAIARLRAREVDRRNDWAEKLSTDLARRFDVICVEDLKVRDMTRSARGSVQQPGQRVRQKAVLNRGIMASGWGRLVRRLEDKAPGRVEKVRPRFTSQRCSACGHVDPESRESQARFRCTACGFACHADVNAAVNIAAGHAVTARGGDGAARPANREPQHHGHPAV
jgi:putative transposase